MNNIKKPRVDLFTNKGVNSMTPLLVDRQKAIVKQRKATYEKDEIEENIKAFLIGHLDLCNEYLKVDWTKLLSDFHGSERSKSVKSWRNIK